MRRDSWPRAEFTDGNATVDRRVGKCSCHGCGPEAHYLTFYDGVKTAFAQSGNESIQSYLHGAHYSTGALRRIVMNSSPSRTRTGSSPEKRFGCSPGRTSARS